MRAIEPGIWSLHLADWRRRDSDLLTLHLGSEWCALQLIACPADPEGIVGGANEMLFIQHLISENVESTGKDLQKVPARLVRVLQPSLA